MQFLWLPLILFMTAVPITHSPAEAACAGSGLSWSCTAGSTSSQVQSAIDGASDGARIVFASGTYSGWSLTLSPSKGVTLQGAGIDQSVVVASGNMILLWDDSMNTTNSKKYRITGFTFQNGGDGGNMIHISAAGGANPKTFANVRIYSNRFHNLTDGTIAIRIGTPEYKTIAAPI
ncbi:MAG TPA: hypothetical protein PLO50_12115, partial [Nitrospira sp.]|nr:hypothetical protein [Nitrospira sp.]